MDNISMNKSKLLLLPLFVLLAVLIFALSFAPSSVCAATATTEEITVIAGRSVSADEAEEIKSGFAAKAQGLGLGDAGEISAAREIILYRDYSASGVNSRIVYNFALDDYFVVDSEFYSKYVENDNFRKLGAPVNEKGSYSIAERENGTLGTSSTKTAQLFEKGILVKNGSTVDMTVCALEKSGNVFVTHPVLDDQDILAKIDGTLKYFGNVDGEMHPLKDVDFEVEGSGSTAVYKLYANYSMCSAYVEYDANYAIKNQLIYAAKNYFVENGEHVAKILPADCIDVNKLVCDGSNPVNSAALSYYKSYQSSGTADSLIELFTDCYETMLSDGFVAGYRCSQIKMWDLLVLDLKFGDGTTGFSETGTGDRERMTCMVYNPAQNKVYPVYNSFFLLFKEDNGMGRNVLGYPESGVMTDKVIGGVTYSEIQLYKNGYIYKSESGNYVGVSGYGYDAENNVFVPVVSPSIPDRYGVEVERKVKDGAVYINYEKGAIRCDLTVNKSKYYYTFYNGRNFDFDTANYDVTLKAMSKLVKYDDFVSFGAMPIDLDTNTAIDFESVIKPAIYNKYGELYNSGFFCGFIEEQFKGSWNGVYAQQFVVGDSTSMIFGEERPYVSALVFNPRTGGVYLMRDDVILTWQRNYGTAGAPTSDEHQVSGCDFWFQTFDFGMTIRHGNLIVFTEDYESPEAYVAQMDQLSYPTHGGNQANGYIG